MIPGPDPEPQPTVARTFLQRHPRLAGYVIAAALVAVILPTLFVLGNRGGDTAETTAPPPGRVVTQTAVVAAGEADGLVIDGDFSDWNAAGGTAYRLESPVSDTLTSSRLGDDASGVMQLASDSQALYLRVEVLDDTYSQPNVGNQIWRGDAFDVNLSLHSVGSIPERPDELTFQLTMTPRSEVSGLPEAVRFVGNGQGFSDNTTQLPIEMVGDVLATGWLLEARVPWSVFALAAPPARVDAALFAVFDNDGESDGGRSLQAAILAHKPSVFFQQPQTWGSLTTP